jgi:hypothetical protein
VTDRRTAARSTSPDFARILVGRQWDRPCRVLDRSASGLRIAVHGEPTLPERFSVELFASGEVLPVTVAWRKPNEIALAVIA